MHMVRPSMLQLSPINSFFYGEWYDVCDVPPVYRCEHEGCCDNVATDVATAVGFDTLNTYASAA